MNSAERIRKPTQIPALAAALLTICLSVAGCGGSSTPGKSSPAPSYDTLFAPFFGTYRATYTTFPEPTGQGPQAFDLTLALGTGNLYGKTVPVVTATTATTDLQYFPEGASIGSEWNDGKAYLRDATVNASGAISQLNFVYVVPGKSKPLDLHLDITSAGTSGALNGNFAIGPSNGSGANPGVIAEFPVMLVKQSFGYTPSISRR